MISEKKVYHDLAERLYKSQAGLRMPSGKTFYAKRPHNCLNCCIAIIETGCVKYAGCWRFDTKTIANIQKTAGNGICVPVKHESNRSDSYGKQIIEWLDENK